jgi:hypothetical protein
MANEQKIEKLQRIAEAIRKEIDEKMIVFNEAEQSGNITKCKKMAPAISELRIQLQDTVYEISNLDFPNQKRELFKKIREWMIIAEIADGRK